MSAFGPKQTSLAALHMSAFGGEADIDQPGPLFAEQFMKSQIGHVMNIVLGIVGAAVASWLFNMLGVSLGGGWVGYLIAGFIGACILIFAVRAIRGGVAT